MQPLLEVCSHRLQESPREGLVRESTLDKLGSETYHSRDEKLVLKTVSCGLLSSGMIW